MPDPEPPAQPARPLVSPFPQPPDRSGSPDSSGSASISFLLQQGDHRGEAYRATFLSCSDPTCDCATLWLQAKHTDGLGGAMLAPHVAYDVPLDVLRRGIAAPPAKPLSVHERNFAEAVVRELTAEQWDYLVSLFLTAKADLIDHCDVDSLDPAFPEEDIESGLMVGYHDIFPFGRRIILRHGPHEWGIFDQYCVRPGCSCREAGLDLAAGDGEDGEPRYVDTVMYDYRRDAWRLRSDSGVSDPPSDETVGRMLASEPRLTTILRERHQLLKGLYLRYRRAHAPEPEGPAAAAVGRNDPCPCGSGRKYKHCCGR